MDTKSNTLHARTVAWRRWEYLVVIVILCALYLCLRSSKWVSSKELHTLMEVAAMLLAIFVGIQALLHYYAKKSNALLLVGVGFIGTALLDGYHAVVTSAFFDNYFPSAPPSLIPWSWNASRLFLSVLMFFSYLAWRREKKLGARGLLSAKKVYLGVAALTMFTFLFFAFVPLPRAYYPELF